MKSYLALLAALTCTACATDPSGASFDMRGNNDIARCAATSINTTASEKIFTRPAGPTNIAVECTYRKSLLEYPKVTYAFTFTTTPQTNYDFRTETSEGGLLGWFQTRDGVKVTPQQRGTHSPSL